MSRVRQRYNEFKKLEAEVIAVSVDSPAEALAFKKELQLPFPVLSDQDRIVINQYGTTDPKPFKGNSISLVATYVITKGNGEIIYSYISKDHWNDVPTEDTILEVLQKHHNQYSL